MTLPQFGEYNYYHEAESKTELIYIGFMIMLLYIEKRHKC